MSSQGVSVSFVNISRFFGEHGVEHLRKPREKLMAESFLDPPRSCDWVKYYPQRLYSPGENNSFTSVKTI